MTLSQLHERIGAMLERDGDAPVVVRDTRSGVVDEVGSASVREWGEHDAQYGVELPLGTRVLFFYVG